MSATIRVLVADDEPMIRAGVRAVLTTAPDIEVVAEAGDGREAVELVRRHRLSVAVLDIRMPGLNGLDAVAEIRDTVPSTGIVMLTTFGVEREQPRGADGGELGAMLAARPSPARP